MEIAEIKSRLTLARVLEHYNLSADKSGRLNCPFHPDKTPSLQVYHKTNTVYCFSSNCTTHGRSLDVIDFILHMESRYGSGCNKHEAIEKAKQLCGSSEVREPAGSEPVESFMPEKLFKVFQANIKKSESARRYLQNRGIDYQSVGAGFNGTGWSQMKHCVIFPLKDREDKIVSFYGRSVHNKNDAKHFYSKDRSGLYPRWPLHTTRTLILTEAVIDAATLKQIPGYYTHHTTVLACYGTNGFTQDHEQAVRELKQLEEVIIFFDGDEAGREGTKRLATKLRELKPELKISSVNTPEGEDVNSLVQGHESEILVHLIEQRDSKEFSFSTEKLQPNNPKETPALSGKLNTTNPHRITYTTTTANYYVKGGLRNEPDSLRVSLDIEHPQSLRKSRSKLDLYEDKQVEKLSREAGEKLNLRSDLIQLDLEILTDLLEQHREKNNQPKAQATPDAVKIPAHLESKCKEFLSKPNLIKRWNELIGKAGVVGEETNRIFLFAIASSYKMQDTLHALIQGSSGSGKTHLLARISSFIPREDRKHFTRVTESSFYNYGRYDLQNKLICLEDLDGMKEEAQLAFRELQSKGEITSSTSVKDENGNISASERTVCGPIGSLACTTKGEIYEDNMSRCFLIAVDESKEQTLKVIAYQNKKSAGQIDEQKEEQITEFIQHCVRMLRPCQVINPYADKVNLPEEAHKIRRLNALYQVFVRQITLLHQFQRKRDGQGRLISQKEDLQIAAEIMFESIVLKVDELDGSLRQFFEQLKAHVKGKGGEHHPDSYREYEFGQREIRQALHVSKTQLHRFLNDLEQLEYIRRSGGYANRGFTYKVMYWDNIAALRAKVKRHLQGQLDQLELTPA